MARKPMLIYNNQRKMHGLPLHRKKDKRKRKYTRDATDECIIAFIEWGNL